MRYVANTIALLLFAQTLASCTSTTTTLYSGEMELVAISGSGCSEKDKIGSIFPLELALEQGRAADGQPISGYLYGPDIENGRFFGNDFGRLQIVYPDEPSPTTQGHTLRLSPSPEGATGELHEKPPQDSTNCYFDKAVLKLKLEATGSKAESEFDRLSKLFSANVYYKSGLSLLKVDKPEEALRDLTKSLNLRTKVNPIDSDRAFPAVSMAIAHIMAGREEQALTILRNLLGEKTETGNAIVKQRLVVIDSLCSNVQYLESDKAATQLMAVAAREFGSLESVAVPLAACYNELGKEGKEQDDPELATEFFQKALKLRPDDTDSIIGIVTSLVDKEAPAEGRRYLQANAQIFMEKAGKEPYAILLSYLYDAEAQQSYNSGDLLRAEQLSREALKVRPGERTLIINLTHVLGKAGKNAEARRLLADGSKGCGDEPCRQEYADELARQDLIELMVKRLASQKVDSGTPHH